MKTISIGWRLTIVPTGWQSLALLSNAATDNTRTYTLDRLHSDPALFHTFFDSENLSSDRSACYRILNVNTVTH